MARKPSPHPTEVELQILSILWDQKEATVRQIHDRISEEREVLYASTVKMLTVMLDKGLVSRNDTVRPQLYFAAISQTRTQRGMMKDLIRRAFDGSSKSLVMQALSEQKASQKELNEIKHLIKELEKKAE